MGVKGKMSCIHNYNITQNHFSAPQVSCFVSQFFLNFFVVFIYFWEREIKCKQERGRERGRHRIQSSLQALSRQHGAQRGAQTHKPRDHDLSRSQMLKAPQLLCPFTQWSTSWLLPVLRLLWNAFQLQKWEGVDVTSKGGWLSLGWERTASPAV